MPVVGPILGGIAAAASLGGTIAGLAKGKPKQSTGGIGLQGSTDYEHLDLAPMNQPSGGGGVNLNQFNASGPSDYTQFMTDPNLASTLNSLGQR
jgi:hypothetical protein